MAANAFELELVERRPFAKETMGFRFRRPSGFQFKAGQSTDLTISKPVVPGDDLVHSYTIASSPDNPETILITTRMRPSAFKQNLTEMPLGTKVAATKPAGKFVIPDDKRPLLFLAGGIGVTPFRSMLKHMLDSDKPRPATLFYSNPTRDDATFLDELASWQQRIGLTLVPTLTKERPEGWPYETGRIDAAMVRRHTSDKFLADCLAYAAGPPKMVDAMVEVAKECGLTEDRILRDDFSGY
jgi:ferredoxin-NADP reductase